MTRRCCEPMADPRLGALLDLIEAAGVVLPDGARVWGPFPDRGWLWHVVPRVGSYGVQIGSPASIPACLASGALTAVTGPDGAVTVMPAAATVEPPRL